MNIWKRLLCYLTIFVIVLTVLGCGSSRTHSKSEPVTPPPTSGSPNEQAKDVTEPSSPRLDSPAANVLYHYAELLSKGDIPGAVDLLGPNLKNVYKFDNYAPLRNTAKMEILKMKDVTGGERPDLGSRDGQDAQAWAVFHLAVRYHVLDIIKSDFRDGEVFYHKATIVKMSSTGNWVITEMSTGPAF